VKFCVDECCNVELVQHLQSGGHNVLYIAQYKPGALDDEVLLQAFTEKRILLTEDKDFEELVYRLKKPAYGIVFLCFEVQERHLKWPRLNKLIDRYGSRLEGHFVVVDNENFVFDLLKLNGAWHSVITVLKKSSGGRIIYIKFFS